MGAEQNSDACRSGGFAGVESPEALVAGIRAGLRAGEFRVAFQPIVHAQASRLDSVECLLRWHHPQYGVLLPAAFEQALHDPEVAYEITGFVLDAAARVLGERTRYDAPGLRVAVNIQPSQLLDERLAALLGDTVRKYGVESSCFELELVESEETLVLVSTGEFTSSLRSMGVRFALDDFGTGYSSLAVLAGAHVDSVKLAREFLGVAPMSAASRQSRFVRTVVDMLAALDLRVVVEGVETETQMAWLSDVPDVYAQGYYVGRPSYDFPR